MKLLITLLVVSIIFYHCKSKESQLLAKYTYPLEQLYKDNYNGSGSCFFYKKDSQIFLITNKHVLADYDEFNDSSLYVQHLIDEVSFKYLSNNESVDVENISLYPYSEELSKKVKIDRDIDIYKIALKNEAKFKTLKLINDFIDTSYFDNIPEEVICYGFPGTLFTNESEAKEWANAKPKKISGKYLSYSTWLTQTGATNFLEGKNAEILKNYDSKYFFISQDTIGEGSSGSPVFGKFSILNKGVREDKYAFIGVAFAGERNTKSTWVIKAREIFNYLNKKSN